MRTESRINQDKLYSKTRKKIPTQQTVIAYRDIFSENFQNIKDDNS